MEKRKKGKRNTKEYSSAQTPPQGRDVVNEPALAYIPAFSSHLTSPAQVVILRVQDQDVILGSNDPSRTKAFDIYHQKPVTLPVAPIEYDQKMEIIDLAKQGVRAQAIARLADLLEISQKQVAEFFHFSERTLRDYIKNNRLLDPDSSEKVIKMFSLYLFGLDVLESSSSFVNWLFKPSFGLGNRVPADLLYSSGGIDLVYEELSRIEYGDLA
ncbi:MAG: DUF2384 domain-containing protein [Cytophagales bacterium]|nr:DUF2384 domain-containing protein [Cytophagales bacterium]